MDHANYAPYVSLTGVVSRAVLRRTDSDS